MGFLTVFGHPCSSTQGGRSPRMTGSICEHVTDVDSAKIFAAIELSKASWLVALHLPSHDKISVFQVPGGDVDRLLATRGDRDQPIDIAARNLEHTDLVVARQMQRDQPTGLAEFDRCEDLRAVDVRYM